MIDQEYKQAQKIANELVSLSENHNIYDHSYYQIAVETLSLFVNKIVGLGVFASKVASTINNTIDVGEYAATISKKQAWVLACAAVENGLTIYSEEVESELSKVEEKELVKIEVKKEKKQALAAERKATGKSKKAYRAEYDSLMDQYRITKDVSFKEEAKKIQKFAF